MQTKRDAVEWYYDKAVGLLLLLYFAATALPVLGGAKQRDLHAYYAAACALQAGKDPYRLDRVGPARTDSGPLPYNYPPFTLPLTSLLAHTSPRVCYRAFLAAKLLSIAGLLALWWHGFAKRWRCPLLFLLLCTAAYREPLARDLRTGNIATFEQLAIWLGALAYLQQRPVASAVLVGGSAFFKGVGLALLAPIVLSGERKGLLAATAVVLVYVGLYTGSYIRHPAEFQGYLMNVRALHTLPKERGSLNPAALPMLEDTARFIERTTGVPAQPIGPVLYILWVCVWGASVALTWRKAGSALLPIDRLFLTMLLYALVLPRFKDYSYSLLVVPSLFVLTHAVRSRCSMIMLLSLLCVGVFTYQSLLAASVITVIYLRWLRAGRPMCRVEASGSECRKPGEHT